MPFAVGCNGLRRLLNAASNIRESCIHYPRLAAYHIELRHRGYCTNWLINGCRFPGTILVIYENRIYQCQPVFSRNRRGWKLDRMVVTVSVVGRHESVVVFTSDSSGRSFHRYVLAIWMAAELLGKKVYLS